MDKKIFALVGATATLLAPQAAQALPAASQSVNEVLSVRSYADLLNPIPNAAKLLRAVAMEGGHTRAAASVQKVQYYDGQYHHHHHHHHATVLETPLGGVVVGHRHRHDNDQGDYGDRGNE